MQNPASSGGNPALETHDVSKHFGSRKAVDALTISVPSGTITGFIGPNGAGKTTTIRLLLGLVRPTSGSATVLGQSIAHPRASLSPTLFTNPSKRVAGQKPALPAGRENPASMFSSWELFAEVGRLKSGRASVS